MWWDAKIEVFSCPVRETTSEIEEFEWWFDQTHAIELMGMGGPICRCVRLPAAGGVGEQDAYLWQALTILCSVTNELLSESRKKA